MDAPINAILTYAYVGYFTVDTRCGRWGVSSFYNCNVYFNKVKAVYKGGQEKYMSTGQVTFSLAIVLSVSSALVAFSSVCVYLLDQDDGCTITTHNDTHTTTHSVALPAVPTVIWASYSWVAIATAAMTMLALIVTYANQCDNPMTQKVSTSLSIVLLTALCVLAGIVAKDADEGCPGDFHDGLLGTSIAASASAGMGIILWIATMVRGNYGEDFSKMKMRYRRARQFV